MDICLCREVRLLGCVYLCLPVFAITSKSGEQVVISFGVGRALPNCLKY